MRERYLPGVHFPSFGPRLSPPPIIILGESLGMRLSPVWPAYEASYILAIELYMTTIRQETRKP